MKYKRFITIILTIVLFIIAAVPAEASWSEEKDPRTFGFFQEGKDYYYRYHSSSPMHKRGELAKNSIRMINGKLFYFGHDGKMQRKDSHYLDIRSKDGSIRYIYIPGTHKTQRYNTKLRLKQTKRKGRWRTEAGMQYFPYGQIDWQW